MLDLRLRSTKERLLAPVAARCPSFLSATAVSFVSLVCCVGAGAAAWRGAAILSVALWLLGRVLDGLDGAIARSRDSAGDFGGYVDLLFDTIGYTAVPLGIAFGVDQPGTWQIVAVLLGSFYVNSVSWLMLSALLEKRGARAGGEQTSVTMPAGLIEGTETIVLFTLALALPQNADVAFTVMAAGVAIGVLQRVLAARRLLHNN
ncbi:CDP-alcohol phosphatidyltransferase family protein [uncultured Ilumatobacter sp.]|jgi:phosphatidylglycerophosphate synthase|uniref:CDP-alcohol phosphatidyltransferase family protein n=1 Tax=uncultured Ilumatobacter sp. TaxID=879968 RepID=UPI00374E6CA3